MGSIYKVERKGRTAFRAQVRKADGTSVSQTFPTRVEAKRWTTFTEQQIEEGKRVAANGTNTLRFGDILDAYVEAHQEQMGRSKVAGLKLLRRRLGTVKLSDMGMGTTYVGFVAAREKDGAGPATILQDLSYLGTVLSGGGTLLGLDVAQQMAALAGTRKMLSSSGRVSRPQERDRRPTEGELVKLIAHFGGKRPNSAPMADIIRFAVCTAMRLSEITALRWDGLNVDARTVLIRDRKHPRQKKGNDQVVPLLRGTVRIGGLVVDPLDLIAAQRGRVDAGEERIFPYQPDTISTAFTRAVDALEIEDLHFHDLRHEGVSRLFEAGLRIEQVALVSGHRDWSMLRRYTNLKGADLHDVLEGLLGSDGTDAKVVPLRRGQGA